MENLYVHSSSHTLITDYWLFRVKRRRKSLEGQSAQPIQHDDIDSQHDDRLVSPFNMQSPYDDDPSEVEAGPAVNTQDQ